MEYKRFTDEERQEAKNTDIIAFLGNYMGFEFKKVGKYYQCRQHDSLMIYPDRQGFSWNSRNISGSDAIDFLRNVEGEKFSLAKAVAVARPVIIALHIIRTLKRHFHLGYNLMVIIQQYLIPNFR